MNSNLQNKSWYNNKYKINDFCGYFENLSFICQDLFV